MCLIIGCPKGTSKTSEFLINAIKKASVSNTDGIGYSFKRISNPKRVWVSKGFKDVDLFIKSLKAKRLRDNDELVIHLRIGNKGAKTSEMNHPFVLSDRPDEILSNNEYVTASTVCHNGTFHDYSINNSTMSDTYFFVKDFLSVKEIQMLLKRSKDLFASTFKNVLKTNRLAFIFNDETPLITLGEFITDEGYFFSNQSYKIERYSNVGGTEYYGNRTGRYNEHTEHYWDAERDINTTPLTPVIPLQIGPSNCHVRNVREKVLSEGTSVGTRARNRQGFLEASSKFDLIPPADALTIADRTESIILYQVFGYSLYVPLQYRLTQFQSSKFVPKKWNYKHFTFLCTTGDTDIGLFRHTTYEIIDFDDTIGGLHLIRPTEATARSLNTTGVYITTKNLLSRSTIYYKEQNPHYNGVFQLMKKYSRPSKNLFNMLEKTISKAIKLKSENGIKFKDIGGLTVKALQIYQNYMGEVLYDEARARATRNTVQKTEVWVN